MGRSKPKKYNKMGYFQKQEYDDKLAKKYNINKDDYIKGNSSGGGRYDNLDEDAYKKAIKNSMRNDFDYRTSAQHMDGVKGKANFNDFAKYEREASKLHRKAGNGGEYSSNKDITGVTNNLVSEYRQGIQDQLKGLSASQQQAAASAPTAAPVALSTELQDARDTVEAFDNKDYEVYNGAQSSDGNDQRQQASQSFLDNFKLDLKSKMRPNLPI